MRCAASGRVARCGGAGEVRSLEESRADAARGGDASVRSGELRDRAAAIRDSQREHDRDARPHSAVIGGTPPTPISNPRAIVILPPPHLIVPHPSSLDVQAVEVFCERWTEWDGLATLVLALAEQAASEAQHQPPTPTPTTPAPTPTPTPAKAPATSPALANGTAGDGGPPPSPQQQQRQEQEPVAIPAELEAAVDAMGRLRAIAARLPPAHRRIALDACTELQRTLATSPARGGPGLRA